MGFASLQLIETDTEHAGEQFQPHVLLAVLMRSRVSRDWLTTLSRELPVVAQFVDQRIRKTFKLCSFRNRRGSRFAADEQAEDAALTPQTLERQNFLIHP